MAQNGAIRQLDFVCTNAGTFSHEAHAIQQLQMQMAELHVQLNYNSQTTQTAQDLGAVSNLFIYWRCKRLVAVLLNKHMFKVL